MARVKKEVKVNAIDQFEGVIDKYKGMIAQAISLKSLSSVPSEITVLNSIKDCKFNISTYDHKVEIIPGENYLKKYSVSSDGGITAYKEEDAENTENRGYYYRRYNMVVLTKEARKEVEQKIPALVIQKRREMDGGHSYNSWRNYTNQEIVERMKISNNSLGKSFVPAAFIFLKMSEETLLALRYNFVLDNEGEILIKILKYAIISTKEESKAYKHLVKGDEECTFDEVFACQKEDKASTSYIDLTKEDAKIITITNKNQLAEVVDSLGKLSEYTGLKIMQRYALEENVKLFLSKYLLLYGKYKIVEQLVKAGHHGLIFSTIMDLQLKRGCSNKLDELIDPSSTSSKKALNMPVWVVEYLRKTNATLSEFVSWYDIMQLQQMSKENFDEYVESEHFCFLTTYYSGSVARTQLAEEHWSLRRLTPEVLMSQLSTLMAFGYDLNKLTKLIYKQSILSTPQAMLNFLKDTLNMADQMSLEFSEGLLYPQSIKKQHDDMMTSFKAVKNALTDEKLKKKAIMMEKFIPQNKDFPKTQQDMLDEINAYQIVVPHSTSDFVNEGNKQHNCVGSYAQRVANEGVSVFFIRRNDGSSFVTAEYSGSRLVQVKTKNNGPEPHKTHPATLLMNCFVQNMKKGGFTGNNA